MRDIAKSPAALAWVGVMFTVVACQLGGGGQAPDAQAETPIDSGSQPLTKSTPTTGGVPIEPTVEPTASPVPTQGPAPASTPSSGGGDAPSALVTTITSYVSADGVFHVDGVIVNDGAYPFWGLEVKYDVLDQQGVVMDTVTGHAGYALLFPGEVTPFSTDFVDPFPREVGDVQVRLEGETMSTAEIEQNSYVNSYTHACEVISVEGRPATVGDYDVVGEVRNTSGQSVTNFDIDLIVYDTADNLLGVLTFIIPDQYVIGSGGLVIAPGETTTFKGWFSNLAEGGEPARIVVGCEGVKTQ
jgi:hypothetical protein